MQIDKSFEMPEGTVTFQGTLSPEELDLVLAVGLNTLMRNGAIPFSSRNTENIVEGTTENVQ